MKGLEVMGIWKPQIFKGTLWKLQFLDISLRRWQLKEIFDFYEKQQRKLKKMNRGRSYEKRTAVRT